MARPRQPDDLGRERSREDPVESSYSDRHRTSDLELVRRYRDGDDSAAAELYRRHHHMAVRLARRTSPVPEAEEIASEAFTKVLEATRRGAGPADSFSLYLRTAVRSTSAQHFREQSRYHTVGEIEDIMTEHSPDHAETVGHDDGAVAEAFDALPERWQRVLHLRAVEGRDNRDSAQLLGIKPTTEAVLYARARRGFRKKLAEIHAREETGVGASRRRRAARAGVGTLATIGIFGLASAGWFAQVQPTEHVIASVATPHGSCSVVLHTPDVFDHSTTLRRVGSVDEGCRAAYQRAGHAVSSLAGSTAVAVDPGTYAITVTTDHGSARENYTIG